MAKRSLLRKAQSPSRERWAKQEWPRCPRDEVGVFLRLDFHILI